MNSWVDDVHCIVDLIFEKTLINKLIIMINESTYCYARFGNIRGENNLTNSTGRFIEYPLLLRLRETRVNWKNPMSLFTWIILFELRVQIFNVSTTGKEAENSSICRLFMIDVTDQFDDSVLIHNGFSIAIFGWDSKVPANQSLDIG